MFIQQEKWESSMSDVTSNGNAGDTGSLGPPDLLTYNIDPGVYRKGSKSASRVRREFGVTLHICICEVCQRLVCMYLVWRNLKTWFTITLRVFFYLRAIYRNKRNFGKYFIIHCNFKFWMVSKNDEINKKNLPQICITNPWYMK